MQSNYFCLLVPSHWKIASKFTRKIMKQILTVQYIVQEYTKKIKKEKTNYNRISRMTVEPK